MIAGYAYIWEFRVLPDLQEEFEQHYGPDGSWARLFGCATGYLETLLLKDTSVAGRYVTVDRWRDEESFRAFRSTCARQYEELDSACERLTASEHLLGVFSVNVP
jgi:heme-degrading monooxygenase HmoA